MSVRAGKPNTLCPSLGAHAFRFPKAIRRGRPLCLPFLPFSSIVTKGRRRSLPLQRCFRYLSYHRTTAELALLADTPRRGGPPCPPAPGSRTDCVVRLVRMPALFAVFVHRYQGHAWKPAPTEIWILAIYADRRFRPKLLHRERIDQQCTPGCPAAKLNELCSCRDVHHTSA